MANKNNKNKQKSANAQQIARIRGNGGYYTDVILPVLQKTVPKGTFAGFGDRLGSLGGSALGARAGMATEGGSLGGKAGKFLGNGLSRILGFGDYSVQSNTLFKEGMAIPPGEAVPSFGVMGNETRVRHREYLQDIVVPTAPTAFTNLSYTINAGNATTFPWLAAVAASYQQYRVNGLIFEFKTLSSDISAGGALGSVIMATDYNVLDSAYADKVHMENAQYSVSAKPSCSQIHTIECNPAESTSNMKYVRDAQSSTTTSQDARLYDLGKFQLATAGLPGTAGAVIGELWCSYDISLYKPQIIDPAPLSGKVTGTGNNALPFGSTPTVTGTAVTATSTTFTFPHTGQFEVTSTFVGTTFIAPVMTLSTATVAQVSISFLTSATTMIVVHTVNVTTANQTMVFDLTGSATVTSGTARISGYTVSLA